VSDRQFAADENEYSFADEKSFHESMEKKRSSKPSQLPISRAVSVGRKS
jgi:hypothetical protein